MSDATTDVLYLGVDGGGTSTVALLGLADGTVAGRGQAGPSNAKAVGTAAARTALEEAIAGAFAAAGLWPRAVAVACLGVAGFDRPEDKALLGEWSVSGNWADRLVLVNDGDLVVAAGTPEGWGVGVIAGTGSIAVSRAPDGRKSRAGGWGVTFGDEGSAYAVAVAALRLIARRIDGRDPAPGGPDAQTEAICKALKIDGPGKIVSAVYAPGMDRTRIAGLVPAVMEAAAKDPSLVDLLIAPAARRRRRPLAGLARRPAPDRPGRRLPRRHPVPRRRPDGRPPRPRLRADPHPRRGARRGGPQPRPPGARGGGDRLAIGRLDLRTAPDTLEPVTTSS
jgi:N-acetylglucosamine kinase-like BadF-type ATPase